MIEAVLRDERGAVAADWVILTAGVIVLGIAVTYSVMVDSHNSLLVKFEEVETDLDTQSKAAREESGKLHANP